MIKDGLPPMVFLYFSKSIIVLLGKESGDTGQEVDGKERQKGCILQQNRKNKKKNKDLLSLKLVSFA
jgi:hypothetical protein